MEIVVGISGASGVGYGVRLLQVLSDKGCVTHLIMTDSARKIMRIETDFSAQDVANLAAYVHSPDDFAAPVASGSHLFDAMVVIPCSMGTLSGIACGSSDTLITRAADVCLKEKRRLILVPRETQGVKVGSPYQKAGMAADFSWERSAYGYQQLYEWAIARMRGR